MTTATGLPDAAPTGARGLPSWPPQILAILALSAIAFAVYGGGYVSLDSIWALVWGRDILHGDVLTSSGTTTPHVLSNLIGTALTPFGTSGDRGLIAIAFVATGGLVWTTALLARELAGTAAGIVAGVLVLLREQLLYAATSNFLDLLTAALTVWAVLLVIRRRAVEPQAVPAPWGAFALLFLAGLLRPEPWALAGALWLWLVLRPGGSGPGSGSGRGLGLARLAPGRLALVVAAPAGWLVSDAILSGDALFSVHETGRVNELVRVARGLGDGPVDRLVAIPKTLVQVAGPELFVLAGVLALAVLWPAVAARGPLRPVVAPGPRRDALRILLAGAALFAAVIAAESLTGSTLYTRFALSFMAVLVVFAAVLVTGVVGAVVEARGLTARPAAGLLAAATIVLLAVQAPFLVDARRVTGEEHDRYDVARAAISPGLPCAPAVSPNRNLRPYVAVWAGLRGREVIDGAAGGWPTDASFVTAEGAEPERFLRNAAFPQRDAFPPAPPVRETGGWAVTSTCAGGR